MNCKPGDLAIVVNGEPVENIGRVIRVIELKTFAFLRSWSFEGNLFDCDFVDDDCLRPIRDPGEDAQDETLAWLPAPAASKEVA